MLSSKHTNAADKRFALRLLIHVVGDVHQPLHAITRVSTQLPKGDMGGNLFP
ncbi:MAG: S1/P1 nuclease [Legionella sp.]